MLIYMYHNTFFNQHITPLEERYTIRKMSWGIIPVICLDSELKRAPVYFCSVYLR